MISALLALALLSSTPRVEHAPPLARLVADDVPIFFELSNGSAFLNNLLDSELYRQVSSLPEWRTALESGELRQLKSGLNMFAGMLGQSLEQAAHQVFGSEVVLALRPGPDHEPAALLMTRAHSIEAAEKLLEATHNFLSLVAADDDFVDGERIRSVNGKEFHARIADTFLIANDLAILEEALERAGRNQPAAREQHLGTPDSQSGRAVLLADLEKLREVTGEGRFPELRDNPLASLLLSGLGAAANDASRAVATLTGDASGVRLSVRLVNALRELPENIAWYFPENIRRLDFPFPESTIASVRLSRDFRAFYEDRFELFDEAMEASLLEFDSIISLFFGGRSFGEEVLPALGDHATLLVGRQDFGDLKQAPEVQLPGFALVTSVDPTALKQTDLLMAFQTSIGLINGDRAQNGLASLMIRTERHGGVDVASARFLQDSEDSEDEEGKRPGFRFNTQPALAVTNGTLIIGSSREQVLQVVDAIQSSEQSDHSAPAGPNSALNIDTAALASILQDNLKPLVANRMIEEGETYAQSARFFEWALRIVRMVETTSLRIDRIPSGLELRLSLKAAETQ